MVSAALFCLLFAAISCNIEDLEVRVEKLEETVWKLEESIVSDYGLVKRCRIQTLEYGISVCRFKGSV